MAPRDTDFDLGFEDRQRNILYRRVAQYYRDYLGRDAAPDEINGWLDSGLTIDAIGQNIRDSDEAKARTGPAPGDRAGATGLGPLPAPADRAGATPPASTGTGGSGLGAGGGLGAGLAGTSFTQPFPGVFQPPSAPTGPPSWWTPPPTFTPPAYKQAPAFVGPTLQDALQDPGYQFAAKEGQNALERSAAAKGVLGTGGTLKDILAWGGNYAQQRYNDVWGRAKDAYTTNYGTQYADPYQASYRSALDAFQPQLLGWQQQVAATQRQGENDWTRAFDLYNFDYNRYRNQQLDLWGRVKDSTSI